MRYPYCYSNIRELLNTPQRLPTRDLNSYLRLLSNSGHRSQAGGKYRLQR